MNKRKKRRLKKLSQQNKKKAEQSQEPAVKKESKGLMRSIYKVYNEKYKALLIIPFILLLLAIAQISYQSYSTGDFLKKGVSLKGGITITIPSDNIKLSAIELKQELKKSFPGSDISVRKITSAGEEIAVAVESDISDKEKSTYFIKELEKLTGVKQTDYSINIIGSSLGKSFFRQTMFAVAIAFLFMGIVVFLYFRTFVPSIAVILAAFSDIVITLAVANIMDIKISTAGIAAFLMLIGYSIDTDILLSTRVLKNKKGTVMEKVISALKTGLTMNLTTMAALVSALVLSKSEVLTQIMTILLIGLLADIINTWIQNVGILRLYLEKKEPGK